MYSSSIAIFQFGFVRAYFTHIGSIGPGEKLKGCLREAYTFGFKMPALARVIMGRHGVGAWRDKDIDGCKVGEVWISESGVWVGYGNLD